MRGLEKLLVVAVTLGVLVIFAFLLPEFVGNQLYNTGLVGNTTLQNAQQKASQVRDIAVAVTIILLVLIIVPALFGAIGRK